MTKNKYLSLFIILFITFIASAIGGFTTALFKEPWYSNIILPSFNPPSWVFGPIWTTLYIMMSVAIWKIWIERNEIRLLKIYFIHLFFNSIWSVLFFGFHNPFLALIDLLIILFFIIYLLTKYIKINKLSFYLMIPYLAWSSYAFVLNISIVIMNY